MIALVLLLQSATPIPVPAPPQPERWSILVPPPSERCVPSRQPGDKDDIIVCANAKPSFRLPLPDDTGVDPGPDYSALGDFAARPRGCTDKIRGCTVGFGPPIVPLIKGAVKVVKRTFEKKPDKSGRVPIPLGDDGVPAGRVEP